jgi:hypothetical protein
LQKLAVYQALWGMENLAGVDLELNLEGAVRRIQDAGFDGIGVSLGRPHIATRQAACARDLGMPFEASAFVRTADELATNIELGQELGAEQINVQVLTRLDRVQDAVALLSEMEIRAQCAKVQVCYETHRGRLTNDLLFTLRVLEELPNLKLTGDLSHYPVVHEFPLPVPEVDLARMSRIIAQCHAFHGRVSGSHQVQVSIVAPQHKEWLDQFMAWWKEGFLSWMDRAGTNDELLFKIELGPPNYAITGPDGVELADRWHEAILLKDMVRELWSESAQ